MATTSDYVRDRLLEEYSFAIDSSTLLAILSDFDDLTEPAQVGVARQTLDILKESATEEESSGFDASAGGGSGHVPESQKEKSVETESVSTRSAPGWATSASTNATDISQEILSDLEGFGFHEASPSSQSEGGSGQETPYTSTAFDELDDEGKEKALGGIFPALKPFDIKWTLKKCKYDAGVAIDELMTQSFLEESGGRQKGIEAFSEPVASKQKKKGKKKGKREDRENKGFYDESSDQVQSQWQRGKEDVEMLSQKTNIPKNQIQSIYHEHGGSIKATIKTIVKTHIELGLVSEDDPIVQLNANELQQEFPALSISDLEALIQITHPSLFNARDLAQALSSRIPKASKPGAIQIDYKHKPPTLETALSSIPNGNAPNRSQYTDHSTAISNAQSLFAARSTAAAQASAAYRKSKSSPLYGGAASYYSQVARDLSDRAKATESAAADALIAQQSSRTELDLHGVNVKDAIRISREKVTSWWVSEKHQVGLGAGRSGGYRIVTGLGRHSEGGKGKLGPAVGKMLLREGWLVEIGSGAIVVRGVAKK